MIKQKLCKLLILLNIFISFWGLAGAAVAQLRIEIIGGGASQNPPPLSTSDHPCNYAVAGSVKQFTVAILPFRDEGVLKQPVTPIVSADLTRSGLFRLVEATGGKPQHEPAEVDYSLWRARGADAVVIGAVTTVADGRHEVRFRLMDTTQQTQMAGFSYAAASGQLRLTAHKIADVVYEKLVGEPGAFATRIAYVVRRPAKRFELHVADADGYGAQSILSSNEPIISPKWSPDGSRLAYVSFEQRKPVVYVQSLATGQRQAVANFFGSNSAPAWSPDGRRLAVVLSRDGGSQINLINADGSGQPVRIAASNSIDTEPNFAPDGSAILFTSDRGGTPQIYRIPVTGGAAQRMTFEGAYNTSARHSPDGRTFTFGHRCSGRFTIAVQDIASRQVQVLTPGAADESPSFSPNGRMIIHASEVNGRGILGAVSSDGRVKQRITEAAGDIREPAWGPLVSK